MSAIMINNDDLESVTTHTKEMKITTVNAVSPDKAAPAR